MSRTIDEAIIVKGSITIEGDNETIEAGLGIVYGKDQSGNRTRVTGPTVPTHGSVGYAKGCDFVESDDLHQVSYINRGTAKSSLFLSDTIRKVVAVSAAEIIAMYTGATNKILVAGVTGKVVIVESILLKTTLTSTAFTGGGAVEFRYTDNSGAKISADIAATMITGGAGIAWAKVGGIEASITPVISAAIIMTNATAVFADGTGTAEVTISYHISG